MRTSGASTNVPGYSTFRAEAYLKGRYYCWTMTGEGEDRALLYFQQSIDLDPAFALGYVGLSDYYWNAVDWRYAATDCMPKARQYAQTALQLNPVLAEAITKIGVLGKLDLLKDFNAY